MKNHQKSNFRYFIYLLVVSAMLGSCGGSKKDALPNATITVTDEGGKEAGLDLQALGELVKKSPNPSDLEKALNTPGSINNLDLDSDGKVDFIKVTESSTDDNTKNLKFTDVVSSGTTYDIADININKGTNNQASMDINGSPQVYQGASYHSDFSLGEVLLMAYLFSPHRMYYSPYYYGSYPGYYHPYRPVPAVVYHNTVTNYNSHPIGTVTNRSTPGSSSRSGISSSNKSQKSFSTRNSSAPVGSGGFGSRSKASSSSSSPSYSSSSHSSSSSSSRRSFGSSRRR